MNNIDELNQLMTAGTMVGGKFADQMANARRLQELAYRQAIKPTDTSGLLKMGLQRETQGLQREGTGLGLAVAGPEAARGLASSAYKEGQEAQRPMEMGEGWYSGGQYYADPYKQQDRLKAALGGQAKAQEQFGEAAGKQQLRQSEIGLHGAQAGQAAAMAEKLKQEMDIGKYQKFKDENTGREMFWDAKGQNVIDPVGGTMTNLSTGQVTGGGAGGAQRPTQYPTTVPKGATESNAAASFNVQRIANAAKHFSAMGPESAAPQAAEATIRSLPLAGKSDLAEGAASWSSSPKRQVSRQAQRDMVEAIVWLDTGAAANPEQFQSLRDAYMPSMTDSPLAKKYKMDRILGIIEAGKVRAGRAWTQQAEDSSDYLKRELPKMFGAVAASEGGVTTGARANVAAPTARGYVPRPGERVRVE